MQFPKELQHVPFASMDKDGQASMKCSSRRNCNPEVCRRNDGACLMPQ